jgi:hypothetical protein
MQAARRRDVFDFTSRLGRRAEAGPRQVLRRVSRPAIRRKSKTYLAELVRSLFLLFFSQCAQTLVRSCISTVRITNGARPEAKLFLQVTYLDVASYFARH